MNWVILNNNVVDLKEFKFSTSMGKNRIHHKNIVELYECKIEIDINEYNTILIDTLFTDSTNANMFIIGWNDSYFIINGSIKVFNYNHGDERIKMELLVNTFDISEEIPGDCLSIIIDKKITKLLYGDNMES
jgi:hypothetical protein